MKNIFHYPKCNIIIAKTEHSNVIFKYHNSNTILVDELITCEDFIFIVSMKSARKINFISATTKSITRNYFIDLHNNICLYEKGIFILDIVACYYLAVENTSIEKLTVHLELK